MRTTQLLLGTLACATAATATAAHAQISADQMSHGSPERRISLGASARADWDNNVNQSNILIGTPGAGGVDKADWVFTPSVRADIVQPIGRQAVFLRGSLGYTFYDKNDQLNSSRINVDGGAGGRLGPCGAVATAGYSRGRVQIDDRFLVDSVNNILEVKRLGASATCVARGGIGVQLSGSQEWGDNSQAVRAFNDFETVGGSVGLVYGRPSLASISVFTSYSRTEYPNRLVTIGQSGGYENVSAGISAERRLGARINANLSVSYSEVTLIDEAPILGITPLGKFTGMTYAGALSYEVNSRLTTNVNISRQVSPTLVQGQAYEIQTSIGAGADYRLGTRVSMGVSASHSKSDTKGIRSNSPGILTEGTTNSLFGSITYRQNRRLSFTLSSQYSERDAGSPTYDFTRTRVGLAANFTY